MLWNKFDITEIGITAFTDCHMGARFMSEFSVFFVMAGWIVEMLFMLFFAYIALQWIEHSWVRSRLAHGCSNDQSFMHPLTIPFILKQYVQIKQL